jgi:Tol biopolymer transport system component
MSASRVCVNVPGVVRFAAALLGSLVMLPPSAAGGAPGAREFGAVFAPDGRTVAFIHTVADSGSIELVDPDGSHRRTLVPRVSAQHLAWSPDGHSLAYDDGQSSIWRVDLDTRTPVRLTTDDPSSLVESWQPSWSPDGRTIAYSHFQTCFRCTAIWLMNSDGTSPRQIYDDDSFQARRPMFSPDGTRLALSLANDLVIDLDGNPIVAGGGAYTIWSPRGAYVAYSGNGLWIRNLQTGSVRRLARRVGAQIAWSPDGKWIAGGLRGSVALVRARDGSHLTNLPASDVNGGPPSFSQGLLVYAHTGECGIDIARENGTNARRLTRAC